MIRLLSLQSAEISQDLPDFKSTVNTELMRLHLKMLKKKPFIQCLVIMGMAFLVKDAVPSAMIFYWGLTSLAFEGLRGVYAYKISALDRRYNSPSISRRLIVLALAAGLVHGASSLLFMPYLSRESQILLNIVQYIYVANGFFVQTFKTNGIYPLSILSLTLISNLQVNREHITEILIITLFYLVFLKYLHQNSEAFFKWSVATHLSRNQTLVELEQKNTEVLKSIAKAEEALQARARVLAAASHDLRQPLQALSIYSAVLLSNPPAETLPEIADNIDRLVRVLGSLLHGLLDYSRLSNDYYVPERQRISLDRLVIEICQEFNQAAQDKQIQLSQSLTHVRLLDDKMGISRIIRNLIDNAIKYTDQGEVKVSTYYEGSTAVLMVSDTGRGIPHEEKLRIYEEFYQINNPGRHLDKGIGLGLTIVQRLCELLGIQIELQSELGRGSSFKLIFNSVLHESMDKPINQPINLQALADKRIYVVDDERDIVNSLRALLQNWQMQVAIASSGAELKQLFLQEGIPDLLIIDLRIGEEQGAHLAKQLQEQYGLFPILVMSGETNSAWLKVSHLHGFKLLYKPINSDALMEAIYLIFQSEAL